MTENTKVLAEVNYRDLADLIFILQDVASSRIGEYNDELTVNQFTDWLLEMKGSVRLTSRIPRVKTDIKQEG